MERDGDLLLGLDVGTSRTKVLLVDRTGDEVALAVEQTPFATRDGRTEMSVGALQAVVGAALDRLGAQRARIAGVGIAGIAESGAPLDYRGQALAPIIAWHDPRGSAVVDRIERTSGGATTLAQQIGQPLRTVSSAAKLGWLLDNGIGSADRWLGVPELCLWALTGAQVTEHSLAVRTGWVGVEHGQDLAQVRAAIRAPADILPQVMPAGAVMGKVTLRGAQWSGLRTGTPVTIAGHDHLAGWVGAGLAPPDLGNSVGTAESVISCSAELPDIPLALSLRCAVTRRPGGTGWVVLAGAARAGQVTNSVAKAMGRTPQELDGLIRTGQGSSPRFDADALIDAVRAGHEVTLPTIAPAEVWTALLAALSARTRDAVDRATALTGPAPRLVVFGGGARSTAWLAAKAAAVAQPVWRSTTAEAVARGAAITGGIAAGWWPDAAAGVTATATTPVIAVADPMPQ